MNARPSTRLPSLPSSLPQNVHPKVQVTATAEGSLKTMQDYRMGFGATLG